MATKIDKENLGKLVRELLAKNSGPMMDIANEHVGKPVEELVEALKEQDQELAVEFASAIIKELDRMGVDFTEIWPILERNGLTEWAKEKP